MAHEKPSFTERPKKKVTPKKETPARNKALSPEARELQLVNLAVNLAEKQLLDGTASPSTINHFLKIASSRETIEREILDKQKALIEAKASSLNKGTSSNDLAKEAIDALTGYMSSHQH